MQPKPQNVTSKTSSILSPQKMKILGNPLTKHDIFIQQLKQILESDFIQKKQSIFTIHRKTHKSKDFRTYSRKEKSLGQLSKNFLEIFGKLEEKEVSLDQVTSALGVERRRIYDIINILESIGAVYRIGKNHYYWFGLRAIIKNISFVSISNFSNIIQNSDPFLLVPLLISRLKIH